MTTEAIDDYPAEIEAEELIAEPEFQKARMPWGIKLAIAWLALMVIFAFFANWIPGVPPPNELGAFRGLDRLAPPSTKAWLGTDGLGRDILSRIIHGARISLTVSTVAVLFGLIVGGGLGMIAGYVRGRAEAVIMASVDIVLAFPALIILLTLVAFLGQNLITISLVIGALSVPRYARVARAITLSVAQREFVLASGAMGADRLRVLWRDVMPNVLPALSAFALVSAGVVIVLEGTLAFLGLSVEAPQATWGSMINESRQNLAIRLHPLIFPSAVMFITVLALNYVGDYLRKKFNVKESGI